MSNSALGVWNKLEELDRRLQRLESALARAGLLKAAPNPESPKPAAAESIVTELSSTFPPSSSAPLPALHQVEQPRFHRDSHVAVAHESRGAGWVLGLVASLCFLLAAAYFIKLGIESGWLNPVRQFGLAMLFGSVLVWLGCQFRRQDEHYSSLLPATGIAVLYLSVFAGRIVWHLYDFYVAATLSVVVSALCLFLLSFFQHAIFGAVAVIGSYLVPIVLHGASRSSFDLCLYFLAWDITFCLLAARLFSRYLISLAAYLGILTFVLAALGLPDAERPYVIIYFLALQFFIFCLGSAWYSVTTKRALSGSEAASLLPLLLIFHGLEYVNIQSISPWMAPWITLAFAVFLFFLAETSKRFLGAAHVPSDALVRAFLALVAFHSGYQEIFSPELQQVAGLGLLLAVSFYGGERIAPPVSGLLPLIPFLCGFTIVGLEVANLISRGFGGTPHLATLVVALAYALALAVLNVRHSPGRKGDGLLSGLAAGGMSLLGMVVMFQVALFAVGHGPRFSVSGLWGLEALILLIVARSLRDKVLANYSLALFGFVSLKVFFFDLEDSGTPARIVSLLVIGAILYAGGLVYRQVRSWSAT